MRNLDRGVLPGILFTGLLVLGMAPALACNLPQAAPPATLDPNLALTSVAQTVAAQLTQARQDSLSHVFRWHKVG